jgi:hypothetical protein
LRDKILLAEDLIHKQAQPMSLEIVDADEDHAVFPQEIMQQS